MAREFQNRVLVTGAAGFIGSHLCWWLVESGHAVVALDDLSTGRAKNLEGLENNPKFTLVHGKVTDSDLVARLAQDCGAIYHLATSWGHPTNPKLHLDVNVIGTVNILEAARHAPSRPAVVYSSSNKVYAEHANQIRLQEQETRYVIDDQRFPHGIPPSLPVDQARHDIYGVSKLAAELFVQDYAHLYGVRTAVFRQSTIYGPRFPNGWIGQMIRAAVEGRPIKMFGNGKQLRDVLFVTDCIKAYKAFVMSDLPSGVWNLGGGPDLTLSVVELVGLLEKLIGAPPQIVNEPAPPGDQKVFYSDIRKLKEDLGWAPEVTPDTGVREIVEWLRSERTAASPVR